MCVYNSPEYSNSTNYTISKTCTFIGNKHIEQVLSMCTIDIQIDNSKENERNKKLIMVDICRMK